LNIVSPHIVDNIENVTVKSRVIGIFYR